MAFWTRRWPGIFLYLLELLEADRPDPGAVAEVFGRLWEGLALEEERLLPDAWQSHLVGRVLDDENPFSLGAEKGEVSPSLLEQAGRDLLTLRELFALDAEALLDKVESAVPALAGIWVPWTDPSPTEGVSAPHDRTQALGRGRLGSVPGASGGLLRRARRGTLRAPQGFPLEGGTASGHRPPRPREARRAGRLRAGAGTFDPEHGALPRRASRPPRPPLRPAGDGQVLHRQGHPQRVRGRGPAAGRGRQGRPRRA